MFIPEIPNNSLKNEIKQIVNLTQILCNDYSFEYSSPLCKDDIKKIEEENNIVLPGSYKEWLEFTNDAVICGSLAEFYNIKNILKSPYFVIDDTVIIGSIIGDGEAICFSKSTGKIFTNDHDEIYEVDSFADILLEIIQHLKYRI